MALRFPRRGRTSLARAGSVLALGLVAAGCSTRSAEPTVSPDTASSVAASDATAGDPATPRDDWPRCGVLTEQGYHADGELSFLVPVSSDGPEVTRYVVTDATGQAAPLLVYAGWWVCITEGAESQPGRIEVKAFTIDQSTGERGQE